MTKAKTTYSLQFSNPDEQLVAPLTYGNAKVIAKLPPNGAKLLTLILHSSCITRSPVPVFEASMLMEHYGITVEEYELGMKDLEDAGIAMSGEKVREKGLRPKDVF